MAAIDYNLQQIREAVYGEEVRGSIVGAIEQCYADANDVVKVSENQPVEENVKIWIKPTSEEYKVPTWEEHSAVSGAFEIYTSLANDGQYTFKASDFVSGVWSYSVPTDSSTSGRSKILIPVHKGMRIDYSNSTFDVYFGVLDTPESTSYSQNTGWITNSSGVVDILYDGYMTFSIRNHSNHSASVNVDDYDSVVTIITDAAKDSSALSNDVEVLRSALNPILEDTKPWELYEERGTNATEGSSSINNTFTKTLYANGDYDYKITLKASIALSADTNIYFRHATNGNLNLICTMAQGETEKTVYIRPTSDCTIIRWNIADSGARYTSTVYERGSAVANLNNGLADTNEELDEVEAGLIHYNLIAQNTSTAASASSTVTAPLGRQLTQGTVYRVNIKSSSPLGADCNVYYRDTVAGSNRNFIGAIKKDESEWTFDVAPNNTADAIRINFGNATTYTITVTIGVNAITDIYQRIGNVNSYDIPSYWDSELADSISKIKAKQLLIGEHGVEFFFITDTHWKTNAKRSNGLLVYLTNECGISSVVFGGDAINTYNPTKSGAVEELRTFYKAFHKEFDLRTTIGNHDTNSISNSDTSTYLSDGEMYALMLRADEKMVQEEPTVLSGYWDNPSQKVRFINVFKIYPQIDDDVKTWVDARITELPAGWKVILFSHAVYESLSEGQPHIPSTSAAVVQHFANLTADAEIICWIVGHCHYDANDSTNGIMVISTQTDNYTMSASLGGATMTLGTNTEQSFDCYQIDTENKVIYITKVGAGSDRQISYGT